MKKLLVLTTFLLSIYHMNALQIELHRGDEPEEIEINTQQGGDDNPTSLNFESVQAFKTSNSVIVGIENYSGNVAVVITGPGGSILSAHNHVVNSGCITTDTSLLLPGIYSLYIYTSATYVGYFTK